MLKDVSHYTRNQARIAIRDTQDPHQVKKFLEHPNAHVKRYAAHKLANKLASDVNRKSICRTASEL